MLVNILLSTNSVQNFDFFFFFFHCSFFQISNQGGAFVTAGGVSVSGFAFWNGKQWSIILKFIIHLKNLFFSDKGSRWNGMGSSFNDIVREILFAANGDIYVGGSFTSVTLGCKNLQFLRFETLTLCFLFIVFLASTACRRVCKYSGGAWSTFSKRFKFWNSENPIFNLYLVFFFHLK